MTKLDNMRMERLEVEQKRLGRGLSRHFGLLFSGMVVFAILSCALVLFFAHFSQGLGGRYYLLYALAIIPLANAVLGIATRLGGKKWYARERALTEAIERVACGDFDVRLAEEDAGTWENIYKNFNKMVSDLQNHRVINENFVNDFSHELKTPIAAIHGFAEVLLQEEVTAEERQSYLQIIASQSARLADLAQNTLMLSKIDSQQFIMVKNAFSLDEQIKQCLILLSHQWEQKQLDFSADLAEVTYLGNEELLQQVWINLFSNAIKFTPEGGGITVTMIEQGEALVIAVSDSGSGMTEETCAHIFEKYYQGDRSRAIEGHGLGLAIVKRIVELHGGHMEVQSVLGQGSTFRVYLPQSEAVPLAEERPKIHTDNEPLCGYEVRERIVPLALADIYRSCFASLGWQITAEGTAGKPGRPLKILTMQRSRRWVNQPQLKALDQQAEELLQRLQAAQQKSERRALTAAVGMGLAAAALLGFGIWCSAQQFLLSGLLLFSLGLCGCAAAFLLYGAVSRLSWQRQTAAWTGQQSDLAALCARASTLLAQLMEETPTA